MAESLVTKRRKIKEKNMKKANEFLKEGEGVLRLKPTWVPRSFCRPGKRIKLHPDDYYVLGLEKGGIDERWFASATWAENAASRYGGGIKRRNYRRRFME